MSKTWPQRHFTHRCKAGGIYTTCLEQWQWGSVQVEGKCDIQNPYFGNSGQELGFEGQALGAVGQLCSAGLKSLSQPALCPNPWPGWDTGIFTAASSHCSLVQWAACGNASQDGNFPFHYHVPDVFQALKLLPAFAVWMHPSSVLEW